VAVADGADAGLQLASSKLAVMTIAQNVVDILMASSAVYCWIKVQKNPVSSDRVFGKIEPRIAVVSKFSPPFGEVFENALQAGDLAWAILLALTVARQHRT
jgi:hypothetical protein